MKEKFGTRAKLIDAICELEKRAKDEGYKARLGSYPVPRLWDMYDRWRSAAARPPKARSRGEEGRRREEGRSPKKPAAPKKAAAEEGLSEPAAPTSRIVACVLL